MNKYQGHVTSHVTSYYRNSRSHASGETHDSSLVWIYFPLQRKLNLMTIYLFYYCRATVARLFPHFNVVGRDEYIIEATTESPQLVSHIRCGMISVWYGWVRSPPLVRVGQVTSSGISVCINFPSFKPGRLGSNVAIRWLAYLPCFKRLNYADSCNFASSQDKTGCIVLYKRDTQSHLLPLRWVNDKETEVGYSNTFIYYNCKARCNLWLGIITYRLYICAKTI